MPAEPVQFNGTNLTCGSVTVAPGNSTIDFNRTPTNSTWTLTNLSIWPNGDPEPAEGSICSPFSNKVVTDGTISVDDANPGGTEHDFQFKVFGMNGTTPISTDPMIINRAQ